MPISSSGHLIAIPQLFGWNDPGLEFDIALHWGTLVAVLVYFWGDWLVLVKSGFSNVKSQEGKLFWFLLVATLPGACFGYLLEHKIENQFRNVGLVGVALISLGVLLYLGDRFGKNKIRFGEINFRQSLGIGFSQALALIPGVSRSGVTISCARMMGIERASAARFSFLLSTPIIFGSAVLPVKKLLAGGLNIPLVYFAVGIITSAVFGIISIKFLLSYLKKENLNVFVWYRLVFGAVLIIFYLYK